MSKRALIIIGIVVVAVIVGAYAYVSRNGDENADADAPETVVVEQGTLESTVGGTGSLGAVHEVNLSFSSSGDVAEVLVAEGDSVVAGQPIAVLDTRDLALSLQSAEANLASARSGVASAQSSLDSLQAGASENELAIAKVQLDQARDRLWGTQAQRDGVCGRVEAGRGEDYECDSQEASVLQQLDAVRIAELQYEDIQSGANDEELENARDKVTQAQAQLASAEASVAQSELRLEQATLSSPFDGTVTALNVMVGGPGAAQPAATISTVDDLEVVISLDETDVASVEVGMGAVVVLDAFPDDELSGSVTAIAPVAQTQSGVVLFPVTVMLDSADVPARPGMTADVEIVTQRVADALIVPLRAIISTPRGDFVALVSPDGESSEEAASADGDAFAAMAGEGGSREGFEGGSREGFEGGRMAEGRELPEGMTREDMRAMRETAIAQGGGGMGPGGGTMGQGAGYADAGAGFVAPTGVADARMVPVTIGATTDTEVQITSGVEAGDVLVVPSATDGDDELPPGGFRMPMMGGGVMRGRP